MKFVNDVTWEQLRAGEVMCPDERCGNKTYPLPKCLVCHGRHTLLPELASTFRLEGFHALVILRSQLIDEGVLGCHDDPVS